MENTNNFRKRFEALEQETEQSKQHTRTVEGRLRWWRLRWPVAAVVALGLALASSPSAQAKVFQVRRR